MYIQAINIGFSSLECRSVTDSVGSHSDTSGQTLQQGIMIRPHMDVVCVIDICQSDNLPFRKKALDEVKQACSLVGANFTHIQVVNNAFP